MYRADYDIEPWDGPGRGERADQRSFVQALASQPGCNISDLVNRINPWETTDETPVAPQTVADKVRAFNAGVAGLAAAIRSRKKR